jgi:hypothetical protein
MAGNFIMRVLGGRLRDQPVNDAGIEERVAIIARLLPGSRDRAAEILAKGPPYGLALAGFHRHSVFLADEAVVFVFAGPRTEGLVRGLVNDRARSAAFSAWAPLLDGTPVLAREEFYWEAGLHGDARLEKRYR